LSYFSVVLVQFWGKLVKIWEYGVFWSDYRCIFMAFCAFFPIKNTSKPPFLYQKHLKNPIFRMKTPIFLSKIPQNPHFPIKTPIFPLKNPQKYHKNPSKTLKNPYNPSNQVPAAGTWRSRAPQSHSHRTKTPPDHAACPGLKVGVWGRNSWNLRNISGFMGSQGRFLVSFAKKNGG
jgi:hypothetical protein